jgi:heme-degrading monooxygenase HmoA
MMIVRTWSARATVDGARAYAAFFDKALAPELARIDGHRGALVLSRPDGDDRVALTVLTFWASMKAIVHFAGEPPNRAVVEPEARAVLVSFDAEVTHHEVVVDTVPLR